MSKSSVKKLSFLFYLKYFIGLNVAGRNVTYEEMSYNLFFVDQDVPNYPEKEVQLLLASRGLSQENFGKLFEAPCKPNIAQFTMIRGGILDFDENQLCTSRSDFSYPKKAKTGIKYYFD